MTQVSTTTPPSNATLLLDRSNLASLASQGPTLDYVSSQVLREALKQLYPQLDIDPDQTLIVTPRWRMEDGTLSADSPYVETLTRALVHLSWSAGVANFIEGEHFLTTDLLTRSPIHLAVSVEDIAQLLNDHVPLLSVEFQQYELAFWNETVNGQPRWHGLCETLRNAFNVQLAKGWNADQCAVARAVYTYPDKTERALKNTEIPGIKACLIDVDNSETTNTAHLMLGGAIALTATYKQREQIMLYTIKGGYEAFDSLEQLGASLPARIDMDLAGRTLKWRLVEPAGNIFDHMAWALIASQMDAINALIPSAPASGTGTTPGLRTAVTPAEHFSTADKNRIEQLEAAIPDWLSNASASHQQDYSHSLSRLGNLRNASGLNDIPLIGAYAQTKMREAIVTDKASEGAAQLPLDDLQITVTNSFTAGGFTLPNPHDRHLESLGDFALQNTAPYLAELHFKNNDPVPQWLTVDYLIAMASQVNIGKIYPQLLRNKLIDDPAQARLQKQRYVNQLPDLLRLKALECKLQQEGGVDETGYRYICELMDVALGKPRQGTLDTVIRPLTFMPRHRLLSGGDTVTNMFIIGPRNKPGGPCLLYRPLLEQPLLQFASEANLVYTLHQPGELRDSILAWLATPALSFEYAQYVFPVGLPSPWLAAQSGIDTLLTLDLAGPIDLGAEEIVGDLLAALFHSNASTMIEQADRQSLSNGERRWALLKDSAWAIFNVASTFLSGPVGTAVWVWQSISEIQQALDAHEQGDTLVEWSSLGDVLVTLAIVLTHRTYEQRHSEWTGYSRKKPAWELPPSPAPRPSPEPVPATISMDPLVFELPASHASSLEIGVSAPRRSGPTLDAFLDTLKVSAPDLNSAGLKTLNEKPPHLYQLNDTHYAQVGERWFQVNIDGDEEVQLFNPKEPMRPGPLLANDQHGKWYVDTRLRLRGGGPKNRLKAFKQAKENRKHELSTRLEAFKGQEKTHQEALDRLQNAMVQATDENLETASRLYTDKLDERTKSYGEALEQLREWRSLGGETGYAYDLLRLTTEQEKFLSLWFTVKKNQYARLTQKLVAQAPFNSAEPVRGNLTDIQQATALGNAIIERLELSKATLTGLKVLGRAGLTETQSIARLLPKLTQLDFKANEIGMSYELCVQERTDEAMPQARAAIADIVVDATGASHEVAQMMKQLSDTEPTEERIEKLSRLADIYADAHQRIQDLPTRYPGMVRQTPLDHLQALIAEFQALTLTQLDGLLPEAEETFLKEPPQPVVAGPSRPKVKVTKTRPRVVETEQPQTPEQVKEKDAFQKLAPKSAQPARPALDDIDTIAAALNLNLDVYDFIRRTNQDAERANRIPADVQDLFDQQALKLEESATNLDRAMSNIRSAGKQPPPISGQSQEMREAAIGLRKEGIRTRTKMLKKRKPRQEYFQWLHENRQIKIVRNEQGRIRTKGRKDYFQEYRILDTTDNDQELWVAHFHYETLESNTTQPTAAHLKVSDKYLATLEPELRQQLATLQPIDYVLRRITSASTQSLFLTLEPQ
ncbi:dermonecrotic toxin domain-containing protein [Pseudomonas sp. NPDC087697]|uniref:dermonecrotic toxin domain-containing protein n=1 Tax=Pseudomonas sp. NPDC087697 TaxID=3364447 RepID=UPI0037F2826B